jgi:uncharacterized membrane protein HdeD (DUF308 family)
MTEPLVAILLIAAPWLFGFDDVESCTIVSVVAGAIMLLSGLSTRWRFSLVKLIPLREHFMTDLLLGIALIVAPFLAGASDRGDATRFLVIVGLLELLIAAATNWDERAEARPIRATRGERTSAAR